MPVVAIVPAWMLADGEYVGLAVGERVTTGLALAVTGTASTPTDAAGLAQGDGAQPGFTTMRGRVECAPDGEGGRAGTVLHAGPWTVVPFAAPPLRPDDDVVVSGWLTTEPYLWAAEGVLTRAVPAGRREWRVEQVRCVVDGGSPEVLPRLPDEAGVEADAAYLLDLAPVD